MSAERHGLIVSSPVSVGQLQDSNNDSVGSNYYEGIL
jgi:hypothetical protein